MSTKRKNIADRFWSKVDKKGPDECWQWTGAKMPRGYGLIGKPGDNGPAYAHRVSWELANGTISPGKQVCHKCDNPPCVNPNHLWLGTAKDNLQDMRDKGRGTFGDTHPNAKLTAAHAKEIRAKYIPNTYSFSRLGREYGVCIQTISNVIRNKIWRNQNV